MRRKIFQDFANLFGQKIYGHQLADAHFSLICHSEIETDEKSYSGPWQGKHLGIRRLLHQVTGRDEHSPPRMDGHGLRLHRLLVELNVGAASRGTSNYRYF